MTDTIPTAELARSILRAMTGRFSTDSTELILERLPVLSERTGLALEDMHEDELMDKLKALADDG